MSLASLGYLRVMFNVSDLDHDETLVRLRWHGAELVGEVVNYEDVYRLCYIRGPEGLLIGLADASTFLRTALIASSASGKVASAQDLHLYILWD